MAHFVVIGAGQAGASLVAKLRSQGFEGQITLFGDEPVPPYQRPPLSKAYLLGDMEEARLYLKPLAWYADNAITLRSDEQVVSIDSDAKYITLKGGETIAYDQLALTTGSTPRRLPASIGGDLQGVYVMRDLRDADAVSPEMKDGARVLIVGGGYIGLEAAAVAAKRGLKVTLVEMSDRILQRVACAQTSDYFRALHMGNGVEIREGTGLERLIGEEHVSGALLSDGTQIDVDFVIVGVGITPNDALAKECGVAVDNGIAVNALGQTSDPSIWSAGDCTSFPYRGTRIRLESVGNAIDQAEIVARNMMGEQIEYVAKPWFWSDQYDCKLQIAGLNTGYDRLAIRHGEGDAVSHWYYRGDELLAVDAMGDPRSYMIGKRLIEAGKSPSPEQIADPATDMKALLKA